jgi:hypothetical protein
MLAGSRVFSGSVAGSLDPREWIDRELAIGDELTKYGLKPFNICQVVCASSGTISRDHRFLPGGLELQMLLRFFNNWSSVKGNQRVNPPGHGTDLREAENVPTKVGIINCNFVKVMQPTGLDNRPFLLNLRKQVVWAREQGGSGIMTAEQVIYLLIRSMVERRLPLWAYGEVRCRNTYGPDRTLTVGWGTIYGFSTFWAFSHTALHYLGAIPEVFTPL